MIGTVVFLTTNAFSITVQQLLIRLAYNLPKYRNIWYIRYLLTTSYLNEHSRASAGGALTDYDNNFIPCRCLLAPLSGIILENYEIVNRRLSPDQTHPNRDWRELRRAWVDLVGLACDICHDVQTKN